MLTIEIDERGVRRVEFRARNEEDAVRARALTDFIRPDLFALSEKLRRRARSEAATTTHVPASRPAAEHGDGT